MALHETYVSKATQIPKESRAFVMRNRGNDELAPADSLFSDFKERERELKAQRIDGIEAHNQAWDDVHYEQRFKEQVLKNPAAVQKLRAIAKTSQTKDLYLICYEKPPKKCHRFILLELIKEILNDSL